MHVKIKRFANAIDNQHISDLIAERAFAIYVIFPTLSATTKVLSACDIHKPLLLEVIRIFHCMRYNVELHIAMKAIRLHSAAQILMSGHLTAAAVHVPAI